MFYELVQLAVGNLFRARARLVMTSGGVLIGTAAVILLIALTIGLQTAAEAGIGSATTLTEIYVFPNGDPAAKNVPILNDEALATFRAMKGVRLVTPIINLQGGYLQAGKAVGYMQIAGIDPAVLAAMNFTAAKGVISLQPGEALVGSRAGDGFYDPKAKEYTPIKVDLVDTASKLIVNKYTGSTPSARTVKLKVVGMFEAGSAFDYAVLMRSDEVIKLNEFTSGQKYDPKKYRYDSVLIRATSRETVEPVTAAIRKMGYFTGGAGDFLNQLNGFFGTMRVILGGVGAVALLVAAFGVANTMTMAILERTKEIGLMKAIGATNRNVLTIFLIEAGLVGFSGGVAGVGVALLIQNLINEGIKNIPQGSSATSFLPIDPSKLGGNLVIIPPELLIFAILLATGVGLGAGFYPSLRAARLQPVIALKSE
jgi:putative ABC transport system permease protein